MPVRFTSPGLGGQRNGLLQAHEWQVGLAYRHLFADQWYVGTRVDAAKAPFGKPLQLDIHSVDVSLSYGVTDRLSVQLTLPFSHGAQTRFYADTAPHTVHAYGLGDVNLLANLWLRAPGLSSTSNVAIALGVKSPSGHNDVHDQFFLANAPPTRRPVDQSIQLGDGGWGVMVQAQAYRRLSSSISAYVFGAYLMSPRDTTTIGSPIPGSPVVHLAVPDVYAARAGIAYAVAAATGLGLSLGARLDGITQSDLIGGRDSGFRRPGYTLYFDPGITYRRDRDEVTLSLPLAIAQDFQRSWIDRQRNFAGGGDLADHLIFVSLTHRW